MHYGQCITHYRANLEIFNFWILGILSHDFPVIFTRHVWQPLVDPGKNLGLSPVKCGHQAP